MKLVLLVVILLSSVFLVGCDDGNKSAKRIHNMTKLKEIHGFTDLFLISSSTNKYIAVKGKEIYFLDMDGNSYSDVDEKYLISMDMVYDDYPKLQMSVERSISNYKSIVPVEKIVIPTVVKQSVPVISDMISKPRWMLECIGKDLDPEECQRLADRLF